MDPRSTLFSATKVLQLKPGEHVPRLLSLLIDLADTQDQREMLSAWLFELVRSRSRAMRDHQLSATGFSTTQGSLLCSILFPRPVSFKFVQQSYKFVGLMFALALVGGAVSAWQLRRLGVDSTLILLRSLDGTREGATPREHVPLISRSRNYLIIWELLPCMCAVPTTFVPPSLPFAMTIGTNFAILMLRRKQIFCTNPDRINFAVRYSLLALDQRWRAR